MSVRRRVFGSISDAAFSALATFAAGAYAVRHLPDAGVALFSLTLSSWIIGSVFPRGLVLTPLEVQVNRASEGALPPLRNTVRNARWPLVAAGIVAAAGGTPALSHVPMAGFVMLATTAAVSAIGSAMLSHVRAAMHIAGRHEAAGSTAFVSTMVTLGVLLGGHVLARGLVHYALPFGALAIGQLMGLPSWRRAQSTCQLVDPGPLPPWRARACLLVPILVTQVTIYLQIALVVQFLGTAESAHLEGARVAASPVFLAANGLSWVLFPGLVRQLGRGAFVGVTRKLAERMAVLIAAGLSYSLALLVSGSLLSSVFGRPIDGLLAATRAASFSVEGAANAHLSFFIALDRFRQPALLSFLAAGVSLSTTVGLLGVLGVFAVPAGQAASALLQAVIGLALIRGRIRRLLAES